VIVLSIPDWAYTNFGQNYAADPLLVSQKINQYNGANRSIANTYGVHYVNVTEISRQGLVQPGLVAYDGLHPSALQYQAWVQAMLPVLRHALKS
jgi:lysophospholipase L1-like esterase